ncbi:TIGR03826 family flagellar region protein [Virgibacillus sp. DJP39]|uniref:TIGR03826 family flagellar region protein n=1 Tax=Virgibacillus sp. DJP39 TaxID=3409790 RepID=UPI003BB577A8
MGELANCKVCNGLFLKTLRDICKDCYEKEETAFKTVSGFLRMKKNREATMVEVVEETGVSGDLIKKFIKEKRLLTSQFPKLGYPCETCGTSIKSGKICSTCSEELLRDLDSEEREAERVKRLKEKETSKAAYYSFKKD